MNNLPGLVERHPESYRAYADMPAARCWLYEVWDDQNRLAYVGIADSFDRRWRQHVAKSWWLREIHVLRIYVLGYQSRSEARQLESAAIHEQVPVYNTSTESGSYSQYKKNLDRVESLDDGYLLPVKKRYFEGRRNDGETEVERAVRETQLHVLLR